MIQGQGTNALPVWQRERVPLEEMAAWVNAAGLSDGFDKQRLYLLGEVLNAYDWELNAMWFYQSVGRSLELKLFRSVLDQGEEVLRNIQRAVNTWNTVIRWCEQRADGSLAVWVDWIKQRQQQLVETGQQFCQGYASWCEQQGYAFPLWLQVALGLVEVQPEQSGEENIPSHYGQ